MKTLYVQINSTPLLAESEDIILLDCTSIHDFCSYLGYELVDGLRMPNGEPYYRAFQVGNLLADFSKANEGAYKSIVFQWEQIQCELLKNGIRRDTYYVSPPPEYIDWLLHHENMAYREVGKKLKVAREGVELSAEDLYTEIVSTVRYRLRSYLYDNQDKIDWIVFSDGSIKQSSAIVSELKDVIGKAEFLRLHQWREMLVIMKEQESMRRMKEQEEKRLTEEKRRCSDQEFTVNGVSFTMVYVKGGKCKRLSPFLHLPNISASVIAGAIGAIVSANPLLSIGLITLSDFHIGSFPVTQKLWKAVMGSENNPSYFKGDNLPVERVSWDDCQRFVRRLSKLTGKNFRLPTEAQWEYAAQGGVKSKKHTYAGSNDVNKVAWFSGNSDNKTHKVGTKLPNELGIYDMSGNVWEWCNDWYSSSYSPTDETDPKGPSSGSNRVIRGGSWCSNVDRIRIAYRYEDIPSRCISYLGFRLVLIS